MRTDARYLVGMKNPVSLARISSWALCALAIVPHLFTCVLPAVLALGGGAMAGAGVLDAAGLGWATTYHRELLMLGTAAAVLGVLLAFRRDPCPCGENCQCVVCRCGIPGPWRKWGSVAVLLLVLSLWLAPMPQQHMHHNGHAMHTDMPN
ncbi:MAG: hypothetical protein H6922_04445 [Pseudomonadaceae bacterium]|nr:hypothetical protein [Pseudomonadaceae bacterium]